MSSEPSDSTRQENPRLPKQSPGRPASEDGRRSTWSSVAAVASVLAVAGGVAGFLLFLSSEPDPPAGQAAPARGLACPYIQQAAAAYERGDGAAFDRTIARAAEVAEGTLQKSGQAFGEPERIALELELGTKARIEKLLTQAEKACSPLGKWNAASA